MSTIDYNCFCVSILFCEYIYKLAKTSRKSVDFFRRIANSVILSQTTFEKTKKKAFFFGEQVNEGGSKASSKGESHLGPCGKYATIFLLFCVYFFWGYF